MKTILLILSLLFIPAVSLVACNSFPQDQVSWEVPIDNFMNQKHISDQIEVPAGNTFYLILGSNPTTGFQWSEDARINNTDIIKQVNHKCVGPDSESPPPPGTPGQEVWTFKVLEEGDATISMEYGRPWEGGEKAEWTYEITITVK
jgi:predicted secreted protein